MSAFVFRNLIYSLMNQNEDSDNLNDEKNYLEKTAQYLTSYIRKDKELPPYIKQKHLILWVQEAIKNPGMDEHLNRFFKNRFFMQRLLFGMGTKRYYGTVVRKDKEYYKKRYMKEGQKFLQSLFQTGTFNKKNADKWEKEHKESDRSSRYRWVKYDEIAKNEELFLSLKSEVRTFLTREADHDLKDPNVIKDDLNNRRQMLQHVTETSMQERWQDLMRRFDEAAAGPSLENKRFGNEEAQKEIDPITSLLNEGAKKGSEFFNIRFNVAFIFKGPLPAFISNTELVKWMIFDSELADSLLFAKKGLNEIQGVKEGFLLDRLKQHPDLLADLDDAIAHYGLKGEAKVKAEKLRDNIKRYVGPLLPVEEKKEVITPTEEKKEEKKESSAPVASLVSSATVIDPTAELKQTKMLVRNAFSGKYAFVGEEIISEFEKKSETDPEYKLLLPDDYADIAAAIKSFLETAATKNLFTPERTLGLHLSRFIKKDGVSYLVSKDLEDVSKRILVTAKSTLSAPKVAQPAARNFARIASPTRVMPVTVAAPPKVTPPVVVEPQPPIVKLSPSDENKRLIQVAFNGDYAFVADALIAAYDSGHYQLSYPASEDVVQGLKNFLKTAIDLPNVDQVESNINRRISQFIKGKGAKNTNEIAAEILAKAKLKLKSSMHLDEKKPVESVTEVKKDTVPKTTVPNKKPAPPRFPRPDKKVPEPIELATSETPIVTTSAGKATLDPLASLVERVVYSDLRKVSGSPNLTGRIEPTAKSTLEDGGMGFNKIPTQGTSFIEQRNKDKYTITCQNKPKTKTYQRVHVGLSSVQIPNDDYLLYAYAQIQTLKTAKVDKNHVIHIKTNDKMLSKSYILMCQLYGLPLESELQISSPKKLKAVSLRLQQLLVPPAKTSLLTRMRGWFGATVVKKPVKSGDATSSSSTRSMTSLFRNKGPAPSMLGKMCGALENHLFNYEESDSESGKAIAFTKLVEDTKLLETARKNLVTESSEQDLKRADVLLQKIHKLLPKKFVDSEEAIKADEVINGPTEEVKKEVDNRFGRGFRGPG